MPDAQVIEAGVAAVPTTRSSRRRVFGLAGASALAFTGLRLPKANRAAAQVSTQSTAFFANPNPIGIRPFGAADSYGSRITVPSDVKGATTSVRVVLKGLSHERVSDVLVALESPTGFAAFIMGEVGGDTTVSNLDITIFETAPGAFTQTSLVTGEYRPRNFGSPANDSIWQQPGPPVPLTNQSMSVFNNLSKSDLWGTWTLWVYDGEQRSGGRIARGWRLEIITDKPPVARTDRYSTRRNKVLRVRRPGVLKNDYDFKRDKLKVVSYSKRDSLGRLRIRKSGAFTFRPKNDATGTAEFRYTVEDNQGLKDKGKLIITVK